MASRLGTGSFLGPLLILLLLAGLFFAPSLINPTSRDFQFESQNKTPATSFPIDLPLTVLGNPQKKLRLQELMTRKSGLLVNFWASWCGPCIEELPSLEALSRQLKTSPQLPELVLISEDETIEDLRQFLKTLSFSVSAHSLYDDDGLLSARVFTEKFPETFWVDPSGKIRHKWIGPQDWLSEDVLRVLATAQTP